MASVTDIPDDLKSKIDSVWKVCPPNPLYEREWICSLDQGRAVLKISAPGGVIGPQAARDVLDWLDVIVPVLKRKAEIPASQELER